MSSDEGEISSSPSQGARKRPRDSSPDSDEEEGALLDKPAAPVHPSQQISNSPYNDIAAASPLTVADTPEPDYQGASASDRLNDRVFSGCSNMENYTSDIKIGEGTFGQVLKGKDKRTNQVVALKRILMHNEKEGMPITALREIKILKALHHPNIVQLLEIAFKPGNRRLRERGSIYMVFPYMDHDLSGLLENKRVSLSPNHIKSYLQQLLRAVDYLHASNILHRDMKSANILIDDTGHLRLADFGLARSFSPEEVDRDYTNCVITRWYRPPELLMGGTKYNNAVDYWGVGYHATFLTITRCVFAEMLKKKPVLTGSSDLDQLDKIFQLCGFPDDKYWPGWRGYPAFSDTVDKIKADYKSCSRAEISLLEAFFQTNPSKRITPEEALLHDYFIKEKPRPAVPGTSDFPSFPSSHEYDSRKIRDRFGASSRPGNEQKRR